MEHLLTERKVDATFIVALCTLIHSRAKTINYRKIKTGIHSDLLCHVRKRLPIFGAKGLNLKFN